jgi:hypothetical protein
MSTVRSPKGMVMSKSRAWGYPFFGLCPHIV